MKESWLKELADFIVEANKNTWAADKGKVEPFFPGDKELEYKRGLWHLRDKFSGHFRAPGETVIRYKNFPVWQISYGGHGMLEDYYPIAKPTFQFLRAALMQVKPKLPFRGPTTYQEDEWNYTFVVNGDMEDCTWVERITKGGELVFTQNGFAGIVIGKTADKKPVYPWDL